MLRAMATVTGAFPELIVCCMSATGLAVGIVLFVLLILALAVLAAYVIYYVWTNQQKMKKGTALSPFANG